MTRLRPLYFIVANTAILLLTIELGSHAAILLFRQGPHEARFEELPERVRRNYAHMRPEEVEDLIESTAAVRYRFSAAGFVHQEMSTRFVNINDNGIRANGAERGDVSAMEDAVWVFGGSTTFGFRVADHETIPAHLERMLGRPVVNLGVNGHDSLMENGLLRYYLRTGYRPAMAIFLDGINETCRSDTFGEELTELVERAQTGYEWTFGMPVAYLYDALRRRIEDLMGTTEPTEGFELTCIDAGRRNPLRAIHWRAMDERDLLCRLYEIQCRTFVQPFAAVHGPHEDAAFVASAGAAHLRALFAELEEGWRAHGATFVTGALDQSPRHPFIDEIHYSADAGRLIAEAIAAGLGGAAGRP
jgi:hypothetical protein